MEFIGLRREPVLKITDTVAKVYGNGPHEMLVCIEYSRSLCFHVSKSENKMMGAIHTWTPIRSVWRPYGQIWTSKLIQVSKRKSGILANFHVVCTTFFHCLFSLYIPLQSCQSHANRWDVTAKASGGPCVVTNFILYHQELGWLGLNSLQPSMGQVTVTHASVFDPSRTYHSTIAKRPSLLCFLLPTRSDLLYI